MEVKMEHIVFLVLFAVTYAEVLKENLKNDDDRWIWGYVDESENKTTLKSDKLQQANDTANDSCKPYNSGKPSFAAPGRRLSEEKCEEYKWEIKIREAQYQRENMYTSFQLSGAVLRTRRYSDFDPGTAVIGGITVHNYGEYPHMGALGWKSKDNGKYVFKCGSTLISSKFVLTAAHCSSAPLDDHIEDSSPKIVRLKTPNLIRILSSMDVNIVKIIIHPNYEPPKQYYDIALMELEDHITFSDYIQPACLWTKPDLDELGMIAELTGWGVLSFGSRTLSADLQVAVVNFINSTLCDKLLFNSRNRNWKGLMDHQLCAGKLEGGVDACQGDSGGPLQVLRFKSDRCALYNVVGVTSFGIGCGLPNLPGVYTRVSSFIDWIEDIVWK